MNDEFSGMEVITQASYLIDDPTVARIDAAFFPVPADLLKEFSLALMQFTNEWFTARKVTNGDITMHDTTKPH